MNEGRGTVPSDAVSFHPVAGGAVVFNAADGQLYAANPVAALAFLCMRDGKRMDEAAAIVAEAFSLDVVTATEWLDRSVGAFRELGLFGQIESPRIAATEARAAPPISAASPNAGPPGARYRLLDHVVHIAAPPSLRPRIDSLLGALRIADCGSPQNFEGERRFEIRSDGEDWRIVAGDESLAACATPSVAAEIERLVVQSVVPATPHMLALHAAALQRDGRTILLAAPSGSGKTTLSVALAREGWRFATDELVLLGADERLRALPLPACIKADSFAMIEAWFPALREAPKHRRYGKIVKYLTMDHEALRPAPVHVLFPRFDPNGGNDVRVIPSFAGLEKLLAQCIFVPGGFRRDDVERLLHWHGDLAYSDLTFSDCAAAVALVNHIVCGEGMAA